MKELNNLIIESFKESINIMLSVFLLSFLISMTPIYYICKLVLLILDYLNDKLNILIKKEWR